MIGGACGWIWISRNWDGMTGLIKCMDIDETDFRTVKGDRYTSGGKTDI